MGQAFTNEIDSYSSEAPPLLEQIMGFTLCKSIILIITA